MWYIYKIINIKNNKVYIGQSIDPKTRWSRHKSDSKNKLKARNKHLSSAILKYGVESFEFEIIAQCRSLEESDDTEIACIAQYRSIDRKFGYNSSPGGQGKRPMSEEIKKKLSKALKGRPSHMKGKTHSEETKKKLSIANKGNKFRLGVTVSDDTKALLSKINTGKTASEETRKKMSESMIGKNAGSKNGMFGKRSAHAKLTVEQARSIRSEYSSGGISMAKLGKKYAVSKKTILNIIHERIYV